VGYWIIVTLIILCGVVVLLAAASVEPDNETQEPSAAPAPAHKSAGSNSKRTLRRPKEVALVMFVPRTCLQGEQRPPTPDFPGTATTLVAHQGSTLSDVACAIESTSIDLEDAVVTLLVGADDFLAGHSLDVVLDQLDRVLDGLANLPAMAVVGSIANVGSAVANVVSGVSEESISTTISIWNREIADLAASYTAEFVDLSSVSVRLVKSDGNTPELTLSACPNLAVVTETLAPAIARAAERVRTN
jgi:hypothetical protein